MKRILVFVTFLSFAIVSLADISGTCGDNLTWTYVASTKTLNISGSGEMEDYYLGGNLVNQVQTEWRILGNLTPIPIEKINVKDGVTSIGRSAFSECSDLISVTIGNSVTEIGEGAFYYCPSLTLVTIPNSVTKIGQSAFCGCSKLTSVTIGNSVTEIGSYAFGLCSGLTSVTIPNSVTKIGQSAFECCYGLTSVIIPNSVTSIGYGAFSYCSCLTSISVDNGNTVYDSRNNCNAIIETATNTLIAGCYNTVIPNNVTSIGNYAFSGCSGLTSVTIPNNVTSIGNYAFSGCSGLTSVTIPNSVTEIGYDAFKGCRGLTSMTIPNSVTSIREYAFSGCSSLTDVHCYAENVPSTPWNAFNNSPISTATLHVPAASLEAYKTTHPWYEFGTIAIEYDAEIDGIFYHFDTNTMEAIVTSGDTKNKYTGSVMIPETVTYNDIALSVTSIGHQAFRDCFGLTEVTIGNSVTSIGHQAFSDCSGLTEVTIGNSVTKIGFAAFYKCSNLASITIGNSVKEIEESAFYDCVSLTEVTIPNSVTEIGFAAFQSCSGLKEVRIGNSVTKIGYFAFNGCYGLTEVTIGNSVTEIGDNAFSYCSGLTEVIIPNSVTEIGSSAFSGCSSLTEVTIGNSVTEIGSSAFSGCSSLKEVSIGNSVTKIYGSAFQDCNNMENIYCHAVSCPYVSSFEFNGLPTDQITLHVPAASVNAYKSTAPWSGFKEIVAIPGTEPSTYRLTYIIDGIDYKSYIVEEGTFIIPEPEPTKEGYTFSGWSEIPETMPAHDVTVTGSFTLDTGLSQIMSDENGNAMIFTIDGKRVNKLQKNLNILRMKDGTTRKVMMK